MNDWYEAEQRVEKAQQLAECRQWVEALAEIDAAISINPSMGSWQAHRGYILDQLERYEDAIAAYRVSITLDPGDVEVNIALGIDLTRMGRFAEAIEVLGEAARLMPDLEPAYCYRILAYSELGEHEKAEEMFYLAQQLKDDCPHCFFHVGGSVAARGMFDKAIYCWGRALDIDPAYPGVKQCIAQAYQEQGNLDRAREYYLAEIRQDAGNVELLFDMAELELDAGNLAKAVAKLRQIVEFDPEYAQAHFTLGEILLEMEEASEALESLRTAAEINSSMPRLQLRMGQALMQSGEYRDATRHLSIAFVEDPTDDAALISWGSCLLQIGRPREAAEKFRRLLALDADCAEAHHNLGVCHFIDGDYECGLSHVLRAIDLDPGDVRAMHKAVVVLMHLRRWSEARAMINSALKADPNDSTLQELRERFWRHRLRAVFGTGGIALRRIAGWVRRYNPFSHP